MSPEPISYREFGRSEIVQSRRSDHRNTVTLQDKSVLPRTTVVGHECGQQERRTCHLKHEMLYRC